MTTSKFGPEVAEASARSADAKRSSGLGAEDFPPGYEWDETEERPVYKLYTAREVAETLGVVERTVRRWVTTGRLPADKEHGVFRIRMEDAREVFNSSRAGFSLDRGTMGARIDWLEDENERLWSLLEKAVGK